MFCNGQQWVEYGVVLRMIPGGTIQYSLNVDKGGNIAYYVDMVK
jgi:hypothetical protein